MELTVNQYQMILVCELESKYEWDPKYTEGQDHDVLCRWWGVSCIEYNNREVANEVMKSMK